MQDIHVTSHLLYSCLMQNIHVTLALFGLISLLKFSSYLSVLLAISSQEREKTRERDREIERDIEIKKKMQGDDNMKTGARDDMKIMALQAPVTAARPVRADLDDHISKPCQFSLSLYIYFFFVLKKIVFM